MRDSILPKAFAWIHLTGFTLLRKPGSAVALVEPRALCASQCLYVAAPGGEIIEDSVTETVQSSPQWLLGSFVWQCEVD